VKALLFPDSGNPVQDLFTCSNDNELDVRCALRSARGDSLDEEARILLRAVELKPTGDHLLGGR